MCNDRYIHKGGTISARGKTLGGPLAAGYARGFQDAIDALREGCEPECGTCNEYAGCSVNLWASRGLRCDWDAAADALEKRFKKASN